MWHAYSAGTPRRHFGQASASTHPHLFTHAQHVTPGIHKDEYKQRRDKLANNIRKNIKYRGMKINVNPN